MDIHVAGNHLSYSTGYAYQGIIICIPLAFCRKESTNPAYGRRLSATAFEPTGRFYLPAHRPPSLIPSVPSMFALQSSSKHHLTRHRNACSPACASGSAPFFCCYAYPYEVRRCAHLCVLPQANAYYRRATSTVPLPSVPAHRPAFDPHVAAAHSSLAPCNHSPHPGHVRGTCLEQILLLQVFLLAHSWSRARFPSNHSSSPFPPWL